MITLKKKNGQWKFHWLTRWEEIWADDFIKQWQGWLDKSPSAHVFFHPAMVKAWVETYLPLRDIRPYFLIAESEKNIVFLPLVLWRRNWKNAFQKLLIPVGYSDYDYHDPIFFCPANKYELAKESFWLCLIDEVSAGKPVEFDRLLLDGIRSSFTGKGALWKEQDVCPWMDLTSFKNSEEYLLSLKSSLRGDLRRQERRMSETGKISYTVFDKDMSQEVLRELDPFLNAHSRRWPAAYKAPQFHKNLVKYVMDAGILHFSTLNMDDNTIAWHLGFVYQNRFYYYLPAQNEEVAKLSPGKVLLWRCIDDAFAHNISAFDHLRGEENYKAGWTDKTEILWTLRFEKNILITRIKNYAVDRIKTGLQKL